MKDTEPIRIQHVFDVSPQTVWKAITDVEEMRQWYFEAIPDFKPEVGFETRFLIQNEGRNFTHIWTVKKVIPRKIIGYIWNFEEYSGEGYTTFELAEEGMKTRLTLKNYVNEPFPDNIPEFKRESGLAGWDYFIKKNLRGYLEKTNK